MAQQGNDHISNLLVVVSMKETRAHPFLDIRHHRWVLLQEVNKV